MAQARAAPRSCVEDAELAESLVLKPLKIRHHQLTGGEWLAGHGAFKEEESTDEGVVHQISVLHEDDFVRTYTVSDAEFDLVGACDPDTVEPDPKRAQCFVDDSGENFTRTVIDEKMESRHYKGGCEDGQKMIAEKGELKEMTGTRIQYWDTTQADWYAGRIAGMWFDKPKTHFLCEFDDETEYAVDFQKDSWRLEPGAAIVPFDQYKSAGFGRFVRMKNGISEVLEFIVLTKGPKQRIHVYTSKYSIRVYRESRPSKAGGTDDGTESSDDDESEEVSDGADRENNPDAEQVASGSDIPRKRKSNSKWWSASSDRVLNTAETHVEFIKNDAGKLVALKVLVPVEASEQEKGASKAASKIQGSRRRPPAVKRA